MLATVPENCSQQFVQGDCFSVIQYFQYFWTVNCTGKEMCFLLLTYQDGAKALAGPLVLLQNSICSKKGSNS